VKSVEERSSGLCPLSAKINTREDHVLGYAQYFFTPEELAGYPEEDKWECAYNWVEPVPVGNCTNGLCPLRKENGDSLMEMMSWEPYQASICDLAKTNTDKPKEPYKMSLFVFGSSMTAGSMTMGQCCEYMLTNSSRCSSTGDEYCAWAGFFIRWVKASFPNAEVNGIVFAQSGYSSAHTAAPLARFIGAYEITEREIIILDDSINDNGARPNVKEAMEMIIRTIFRLSKGMLPTIIVYDQWLFDPKGSEHRPKNMS
jgi:hypothetical protein